MLQELKFQLSTAMLTILTIAAVVSAVINFQQQQKFRLPEDGVIWAERDAMVQAVHVARDSQAARAGIRNGDRLLKINGTSVEKAAHVTQALAGVGSWNKAEYLVSRRGVEFKAAVIVGEVPRDAATVYLYVVGIAYLVIGLFIYYRRGSAHKARHFY